MMNSYESDPLYWEILEGCDGDEILAAVVYDEINNEENE